MLPSNSIRYNEDMNEGIARTFPGSTGPQGSDKSWFSITFFCNTAQPSAPCSLELYNAKLTKHQESNVYRDTLLTCLIYAVAQELGTWIILPRYVRSSVAKFSPLFTVISPCIPWRDGTYLACVKGTSPFVCTQLCALCLFKRPPSREIIQLLFRDYSPL